MPADFSTAAKNARLQIAVPQLDIEAICERSVASGARARMRRLVVAAALSLGVIGSAVALGQVNQGIHMWIFGNTFEATIRSFSQVRAPMAADVERIVKSAAFTVTAPTGVPKDYRIMWIAYTPADHPTFITVKYRSPVDAGGISVTVVQTSSIVRNRALLREPTSPSTTTHGVHFQLASETVLVQGLHVTPAQAARVEQAMQSATPAQALADLEKHVSRLLDLAPVPSIPLEMAAEHVAPLSGNNALLGRWALHELPQRAARNQPLRDPRPIQFTNIPSVHGEPDYRNATVQFARPVAIPADGVQKIAATLKRANIGPKCGCAILVHESGNAYAIWKIDAAPPYRARKLTGP